MNASEMTFGVEFEVTLPVSTSLSVGGYHRGVQVQGLPAGWNAQGDASISVDRSGYRGVEIVSPILKGMDGVRQVMEVCDWLRRNNARVNRSTGFHVHIGWTGNAKQLAILTGLVAYHETAIYASTGTTSREQGSYCRPIKNSDAHKMVGNQTRGGQYTSRYHSLNLTNLFGGRQQTVEFRAFAGTCNATKAIAHVEMCLALVEKALEMKVLPKWDAKQPEPTSRAGKMGRGKHALTRFFVCFGWTKGKTKRVYGHVTAPDQPTIESCKATLVRMAEKYDGR